MSSVSSVTGIKERPTKKQKVVNQGDFSGWEEEMDKFIAESDNEDFEASPSRVPDRDSSFVSDRKNRVYPAPTFWVVTNVDYMSVADFETKLRQIMLKADLDIDHCTPVKSRKKTSTLKCIHFNIVPGYRGPQVGIRQRLDGKVILSPFCHCRM